MDFDPKLMATIGTSFITSLAAKGITGPAETINDLWKVSFGYPIHYFSEKRRIKYEINLQKFEKELTNKILEIPKENVQEPKESIIGPALEASKYYFDEEEIRELFANLIASSMDSTYNGLVQHSFVEIIKQLSPYDAKFLATIENDLQTYDLKDNQVIFYRLFGLTHDFLDYQKNSVAITNLHRLGLLDLIQYFQITASPQKEFLLNSQTILELKKNKEFSMQPHTYVLSSLGEIFKKVCIKDSL